MGWFFGKKKKEEAVRKEEAGRTVSLTGDQKKEIMDLLANGRKIEAIRVLMNYTGLSLAEAKSIVENNFDRLPVTETARQTGKIHSLDDLPDDQKRKVANLLYNGRKIEAIKLLMDYTGLGLAEAKAIVEKEG